MGGGEGEILDSSLSKRVGEGFSLFVLKGGDLNILFLKNKKKIIHVLTRIYSLEDLTLLLIEGF